ncbi:MAG TPA: hypothetical protein VEY69_01730 [Lautropia sp.]|nr:hypothetical protein [Lautropia sp.]
MGLYNAGVNQAAARVIVVAGALMQPLWVPPEALASRLEHLSSITDLQTAETDLPRTDATLPRELAHDRWLRMQVELKGAAIEAGALSAVRRLASFGDSLTGWLVEPVHFHLAQDHLVLLAGSAQSLATVEAQQLAQSIQPLLEEDGFTLTILGPTAWLLASSELTLQVNCASSEAAAGRNVHGYLPAGVHARRFRKLLNEVQMTWHGHPVNQAREARGELPINSIWMSGPVAPRALAAWNKALSAGRFDLEDSLLAARLRDDRFAWLDALQAMDARLATWLASPEPPAILLCGDHDCRWLQRRHSGILTGKGAAGSRLAALARRFGELVGASGTGPAISRRGGAATLDDLAGMFTERSAA